MDRIVLTTLALVAGLALFGPTTTAEAQAAPDLRNIRPMVTLLVDSSGSMERKAACTCTTASCRECMPNCAASERNRWSMMLEAFTGTFDTFTCTENNRSGFVGDYDYRYFLPHFEPPVGVSTQQSNGVLDTYIDRIRFAMMTFDGVSTLTTQSTLVPAAAWTAGFEADSAGILGMYSYGGSQTYTFLGCATDYKIDNGARNESTLAGVRIPGNLISMGDDADDHTIINAEIQDSLLGTRPFGPTPIAGLLSDYEHYMQNHPDVLPVTAPGGPGDDYAACRAHFAVLVTDGYPNADMRGTPYHCDAPGFNCPYDLPQDIAQRLCVYDSGADECTGEIDGLFTVGFNVSDPAAVTTLDGIAAAGGTQNAFFASDRPSLVAALSAAFDSAAPGATSRTVPAFVSAASVASTNASYQFNAGFKVGGLSGTEPWSGVLERRRWVCTGTTPARQDPDPAENDLFHVVLNDRSAARNLYTVVPSDLADRQGWLTNDPTADIAAGRVPSTALGTPDQQNLTSLTTMETSTTGGSLGYAALDAPDLATADDLLDWLHGRGSVHTSRVANRLGDIYHSSPAVVGAPRIDRTDEAFNLFRRRGVVAARPTVLYVGTNDGVLHAFAVEDHDVAQVCSDIREISDSDGCPTEHLKLENTEMIEAGEELWGFVPPMLLGKVEDAAVSHQWMVDGTPAVRDVFYARVLGDPPTPDEYHTVLVAGLRNGGAGVFALDVTDPLSGTVGGSHDFEPKFLWQFTDADMGETYGTPTIAQVLVDESGVLVARAVAIIPGGNGTATGAQTPKLSGDQLPEHITGAGGVRNERSEYTTTGRALYVVDIATGRLLRKFDSTFLTAPMTGAVAAFPGDVGQIADRAFMTDADGVIWRLDMSDPDPANWELVAFHDIFRDQPNLFSQPAFNPPVLSVDEDGDLVILQATGNIDILDGTEFNRVVSITEDLTFDTDGEVTDVKGTFNWEIDLDPSEQVTGPLELFDSRVYFGSFKSITSTTDACQFGESRLWGVHYTNNSGGTPEPGLESPPASGTYVSYLDGFTNQIIMGVAVAQTPTCIVGGVETDVYLGSRYRVTGQGGGTFSLVAQIGGDGSVATGSELADLTRTLPSPTPYTELLGYAGAVD